MRAFLHLDTRHEFDLRAKEIHEFLGIDRRGITQPNLPADHHAAHGAKRRRLLHDKPRGATKPGADEQQQHPPPFFQKVDVADRLHPDAGHGVGLVGRKWDGHK